MRKKNMKDQQTIAMAGTILTQDPLVAPFLAIGGRRIEIKPVLVGTMYRVAAKALVMKENTDLELLPDHIDSLSSILALVLKNREEVPDQAEINRINRDFTGIHLFSILVGAIGSNAAGSVKEYFLDPSEPMATENDSRSMGQKRRDSLPHTTLGSFCRYFKTSLNEVLWHMSWDNMVIMLSAIEKPDKNELDEEGNPRRMKDGKFDYPVKDAFELF